jgi:hypothetical protein
MMQLLGMNYVVLSVGAQVVGHRMQWKLWQETYLIEAATDEKTSQTCQ